MAICGRHAWRCCLPRHPDLTLVIAWTPVSDDFNSGHKGRTMLGVIVSLATEKQIVADGKMTAQKLRRKICNCLIRFPLEINLDAHFVVPSNNLFEDLILAASMPKLKVLLYFSLLVQII